MLAGVGGRHQSRILYQEIVSFKTKLREFITRKFIIKEMLLFRQDEIEAGQNLGSV